MGAQAGGARDPRAAALGAVWPVAVGAPAARELAPDCAQVTTHAPRDLADAQAKVAVSLSHGDPGHSR